MTLRHERDGPGRHVDGAAPAGLHLYEADLLFEIVDPASGAPRAAGDEGELVFGAHKRLLIDERSQETP
jgi:phenylacetate-coenzyme A ligase PaaK-like adenylate-forming protein